ncbi:hypothetical protein Y697_07450 [Mesotoga sp. BH458_6_3_2_1]|nr:hypothetical protein Y697_07450 [Mesotoga sp. BH458_6_3_2_1]
MDARLAKNMPGRNARFAGKDLLCQSANAGQSLLRKGQFRRRPAKRAAWIRNADRCTLGKASQEVMPL